MSIYALPSALPTHYFCNLIEKFAHIRNINTKILGKLYTKCKYFHFLTVVPCIYTYICICNCSYHKTLVVNLRYIMSDYISIVYEYVTERKVKQCGYHENSFSGGKHTVLCWSIYLQYSYLL